MTDDTNATRGFLRSVVVDDEIVAAAKVVVTDRIDLIAMVLKIIKLNIDD